jgi:deazaflavin-dependent oxidoreductase (nitroreductase family)
MAETEVLYGLEHVDRYRATGGVEGHDWRGTHTLILTTTGRHSGERRSTPLIYGQSGEDYLIVASQGGAPKHPAWYLNLSENPEVEVQVKDDRFKARAHTATPDEKARLWKIMTEQWPDYDKYQQRTEREIPLVVLERI